METGTENPQPRLARHLAMAEVYADQTLSQRFASDLNHLLAETKATARERSAGWDEWLAAVTRTLGPSLAGMVIPAQPATAPVIPANQRHLWRNRLRVMREAVVSEPQPWPELRMTVARLYLDLLAAGVWEAGEEWRPELRDVVSTLPLRDGESVPGQLESYLSSLVAVCLALLCQEADLFGSGPNDAIAKSAWDKAAELAAFAEAEQAERYLYNPDQPYARVATRTDVDWVIELAVDSADDPHAELRAAFESAGLDVDLIDSVWVSKGTFKNPRRAAARIATLVGGDCVTMAYNDKRASVIIRSGREVVVADSTAPRWRYYKLTTMATPESLLGDAEGLPPTRENDPFRPVPGRVQALFAAADVNAQHILMLFDSFRPRLR
ncbi:hypothetical protein [Kutzneria buriramensis]|uniref:Uncharacterized protein n=1 Tax=Kutzneria buriramensis TaxID=1045776 RepID=A0A3E0HAG4_9PSEU|nr:hypothetical protein [Kutzneria buriramensis]REH40961.1 hypothetical protein BCF44_11242 [Kutzneria buriramensis]